MQTLGIYSIFAVKTKSLFTRKSQQILAVNLFYFCCESWIDFYLKYSSFFCITHPFATLLRQLSSGKTQHNSAVNSIFLCCGFRTDFYFKYSAFCWVTRTFATLVLTVKPVRFRIVSRHTDVFITSSVHVEQFFKSTLVSNINNLGWTVRSTDNSTWISARIPVRISM